MALAVVAGDGTELLLPPVRAAMREALGSAVLLMRKV